LALRSHHLKAATAWPQRRAQKPARRTNRAIASLSTCCLGDWAPCRSRSPKPRRDLAFAGIASRGCKRHCCYADPPGHSCREGRSLRSRASEQSSIQRLEQRIDTVNRLSLAAGLSERSNNWIQATEFESRQSWPAVGLLQPRSIQPQKPEAAFRGQGAESAKSKHHGPIKAPQASPTPGGGDPGACRAAGGAAQPTTLAGDGEADFRNPWFRQRPAAVRRRNTGSTSLCVSALRITLSPGVLRKAWAIGGQGQRSRGPMPLASTQTAQSFRQVRRSSRHPRREVTLQGKLIRSRHPRRSTDAVHPAGVWPEMIAAAVPPARTAPSARIWRSCRCLHQDGVPDPADVDQA